MSPQPFAMRAYRGVSHLLYPAARSMLARRQERGKEDALRLEERKGFPSVSRPDGLLVWLHGASVGELISLLPVAEHFRRRGNQVLVTSGTVTSAEVASRRLPEGAIHQYIPLDLPAYVARFLDHWRPDIGVFAESELWPNLIHESHARGVHLVTVNARMSERSFRRWSHLPSFASAMLSRFELVLAQTPADAGRLRALGAPRVGVIGNLKYDVTPPPADDVKLEILRRAIGRRAVFVAASTHPGEEELVAAAHGVARDRVPGLLTIIAPRHPERGEEAAAAVFKAGLSVARRSEGAQPDVHTDVYIADTIGELGLFYRLGRIAYLGGSLVEHGGQNPIEPAKLDNAILHGPHVKNFAEVYAALHTGGGAVRTASANELGEAIASLITDAAALDQRANAANAVVAAMSGAVQRTIDGLEPLVMRAHLDRKG
ncbi:MAG: 3-deoxy-D-manno-octulosonic acid transferase [Beijerinckiaceae bacterium]